MIQATTRWTTMMKIKTDLAIHPPKGTYCQLLSRSGLLTKHNVEVKAGTIERDYTGNVMVVMQNNSDMPYNITCGDQITQMVLYYIAQPPLQDGTTIPEMQRASNGFGSTDSKPEKQISSSSVIRQVAQAAETTPTSNASNATVIPSSLPKTLQSTLNNITLSVYMKPYEIWLCPDPFQKRMTIPINLQGTRETLGLLLQPTEHKNRVQ